VGRGVGGLICIQDLNFSESNFKARVIHEVCMCVKGGEFICRHEIRETILSWSLQHS
jgi:hypothetical protein